ncbi:hypothetical protein PoB_002337600 [Plakobranchus ocellatus]|uniref:Uncharacterized protein n=1 Tax=Plakobranchus ocellatus TaxID=259542 RepID=A0AAV3ZLP4_9GAST|nr:hypothetical protein PoB_002337600 [Plakobranchus ocellatus]
MLSRFISNRNRREPGPFLDSARTPRDMLNLPRSGMGDLDEEVHNALMAEDTNWISRGIRDLNDTQRKEMLRVVMAELSAFSP